MSTRFEKTLGRLQALAEKYNRTNEPPARLVLVGGFALGAWGVVRATQDIDFLLDAGSREAVERFLQFLHEHDVACRSVHSTLDDPLPWLVELPMEGSLPVPVHLIVVTRAWEATMVERATEVELASNLSIRVVQPGDLLLLKLKAGGPQDLLDAKRLGESMKLQAILDREKLRATATAMNVLSELETFLGGD